MRFDSEAVGTSLYRNDYRVCRSDQRRTVMDENFAPRRIQVDWDMPMNRVEWLGLYS